MPVLKIVLILLWSLIAFQDFRERAVIWVVFPIMGVLLFLEHKFNANGGAYLVFITINLLLVSGILLLLFLYTKHIARKRFLNVSFGMGDLLFFYAFSFGFPTITFVVLLVSTILFSLLTVILLQTKYNMDTIPLAGLMSVFLIVVTLASLLPGIPSLYLF